MPSSIRKGPLILGLAMFVSFFGVLAVIFSPVFDGMNGLDYADNLFNRLAKGSSDFIPKLLKKNEKNMGKSFRAILVFDKEPAQIAKICSLAGVKTERNGTTLTLEGDLGKVLQCALRDANHVFNNTGASVSEYYQSDEKNVMRDWWTTLTKIERNLKKNLKVEESNAVSEVVRKGVEPAYNFHTVEAQSVTAKAGTMTLLLAFYLLYTLWWGYAILYLFEGLGLSMKKAKVKKEVA